MITCEACGEILPDGTQFCSNCGTPVSSAAPLEPDPVPTLPPESVFENSSPTPEQDSTLAEPSAEPISPAAPSPADSYGQSSQESNPQNPYVQQTQTQNPYQQTASAQNPYTQNPYSQNPYAQNTYSQNPHTQSSYPQNPYTQNTYSQNPYQNTYSQNPYGQSTYSQSPYTQNPYSQNPYTPYPQNYPQRSSSDGKGVAAMILGILSLVFACSYGIGIVFGIIGLVLAIIARKDAAKPENTGTNTGAANAGLVCSIVGIIGSALMILCVVIVLFATEDYDDVYESTTQAVYFLQKYL